MTILSALSNVVHKNSSIYSWIATQESKFVLMKTNNTQYKTYNDVLDVGIGRAYVTV